MEVNPVESTAVPAVSSADLTPSDKAPADQDAAAPSAEPKITLDQLINLSMEKEASDMHIREGGRVALRLGGKMMFIENIDVLTKEDTERMVDGLISSDDDRERFEKDREIDFSYTHKNGVNFRVNVFYQQGRLAAVLRMISKNIPTLEELGIPEVMKNYLGLREGLILVCGSAGSGKSTTVQSMLEYINQNYIQHILTIENPVEYVFEGKNCMFTQREIGKDVPDLHSALQSAVREDVNVVMINEVKDYETFDKLLNLVETGHLVIASMLTRDATQTMERILGMYPAELKKQVQDRISTNLKALIVQDLAERQDTAGMVGVFELMFMNQGIQNVLKRGNLVQLKSSIQAGNDQQMITMESYATQLAEQGIISQEQVNEYTQRGE